MIFGSRRCFAWCVLGLAALWTPSVAAAEVNLYAAREAGLMAPLLAGFTARTGIKVNTVFLNTGLAERVAAEGASSPADMLMVVDIAALTDLARRGLTQPVQSAEVTAAVPATLRDPAGHWVALSLRARAIFVARDRLTDPPTYYEALAEPRWRGKLCMRAGQHPYNTALIAALISRHGEPATAALLGGFKANLAHRPSGGDRDVARDIMAGICDVGLANTYYAGLMLSGAGGAEQKRWGEAVRVVLPSFKAESGKEDGGTHVNVSGAAIARHAPNRAEAFRLLEFLVSAEGQKIYAEANFEYPVRPGVPVHPILASFGILKIDETPLPAIAAQREAASLLVDRTGLDR